MEFTYGHWKSDTPRPDNAVGFVYVITHKNSGCYYYGQKKLEKRIKRKPLKGKKRNRISYKESSWESYTGSGIISQHAQEHRNAYEFHILDWCANKTTMNLIETSYIINSITDEKNLNQVVNIRVRVKKDPPDFIKK